MLAPVMQPSMSKQTILGAALLAAALVIIVLSFTLGVSTNAIDPNWQGNPLPPCFVNAGACYGHLLGTDEIGRDVLARLALGARVTLGLSFCATALSLAVGVALGTLARRGGEVVTFVVFAVADAVSSVAKWPFIIAVVAINALTHHVGYLQPATLAILAALLFWPTVARLTLGAENPRDITGPLLAQTLADWAALVLVLATVDFFGFGVQPPLPSWGNMLANVQSNMQTDWWVAVAPAICLFTAIFILRIASGTFGLAAPSRRNPR
jgi:peptide/nickel transport system permease protein